MNHAVKHVSQSDLALVAGGELGLFRRFIVQRHLQTCALCHDEFQRYAQLRRDLAETEIDLPELHWSSLAAEMHANIRLGLEAGACIEPKFDKRRVNPRLAVAFASLCVLAASGFYFSRNPVPLAKHESPASVLAATAGGLELRTGANSLTLLNHHGAVADQTVGAEGEIRARFVDSETGSVTINNVYLEN